MVKNSIKVYARLKREDNLHKITQYSIIRTRSYDNLIIKGTSAEPSSLKTIHKFRFVRIFDLFSTQSEVFEIIAKPIVNSVIDGFNGTIFAYGQTGSGKTYAITGSSKDYHERGVIPRSIEHVFDNINKSPHSCNIFISYMEIYNEIGYDLLNVKQQPTSHLEELPRVALLEDANGESHFRNLTVHAVTSTQEAMRLLYLGAANRTIVETPMNESSSRSHCIFTIYVCTRKKPNGTIVRSKLHLVDLAGSERVHKTKITGHVLTEAKAINLSLYYLEQVITALRHQSRNSHIPFRNSMMTNMLKDSLTGNCLSSMIATLSVDPKNILETLSTCKFAQRVALVNTDPYLNREIDFSQEVELLREENNDLRRQLTTVLNAGDKSLPSKEAARCREDLERFLNNEDEEFQLNLRDYNQVVFCFNMMKSIYLKEKHDRLTTESNLETIESYKKAIQQKNEEIFALNKLMGVVANISKALTSNSEQSRLKDQAFEALIEEVLGTFASLPDNNSNINNLTKEIQDNYVEARKLSRKIKTRVREIAITRKELDATRDSKTRCELEGRLLRQQDSYEKTVMQLCKVSKKADSLRQKMERTHEESLHSFKQWGRDAYEKLSKALLARRESVNSDIYEEDMKSLGMVMQARAQSVKSSLNLVEEKIPHHPKKGILTCKQEGVMYSNGDNSNCLQVHHARISPDSNRRDKELKHRKRNGKTSSLKSKGRVHFLSELESNESIAFDEALDVSYCSTVSDNEDSDEEKTDYPHKQQEKLDAATSNKSLSPPDAWWEDNDVQSEDNNGFGPPSVDDTDETVDENYAQEVNLTNVILDNVESIQQSNNSNLNSNKDMEGLGTRDRNPRSVNINFYVKHTSKRKAPDEVNTNGIQDECSSTSSPKTKLYKEDSSRDTLPQKSETKDSATENAPDILSDSSSENLFSRALANSIQHSIAELSAILSNYQQNTGPTTTITAANNSNGNNSESPMNNMIHSLFAHDASQHLLQEKKTFDSDLKNLVDAINSESHKHVADHLLSQVVRESIYKCLTQLGIVTKRFIEKLPEHERGYVCSLILPYLTKLSCLDEPGQSTAKSPTDSTIFNCLSDLGNVSRRCIEKLPEEEKASICALILPYLEKLCNPNSLSPSSSSCVPVVDSELKEGNPSTLHDSPGLRNVSIHSTMDKVESFGELQKKTDTESFKMFMKSVPLTGDLEVDEEIFSFYRDKFKNLNLHV